MMSWKIEKLGVGELGKKGRKFLMLPLLGEQNIPHKEVCAMAKSRKVTIRQMVDRETEQQLRELVAQHNQQKSTQSQSQPSSNQSNQNQPSQNDQNNQNPEGFPVVVSRAFPILNEGCGGLRGLATRVYTPSHSTLAPARLMDKRHAELQNGDIILEANVIFAGQSSGNVRVYRVYFTTDNQAQVKWMATLGPDGKILSHNPTEKNLLDEIYQSLFIRARHALNAAFTSARKASTRLYVPTRRPKQPRRQFSPNPYLVNW